MIGGYIYLPEDISLYIFTRAISNNNAPEKKDGYFNILKNILNSKKPIVFSYKRGNDFTIGYAVGTYSDGNVKLGITSQLFSSNDFATISLGVIVTPDDNVTVLRKNIGG